MGFALVFVIMFMETHVPPLFFDAPPNPRLPINAIVALNARNSQSIFVDLITTTVPSLAEM